MDHPRRSGVAWVGIDDRGACRQAAAHLVAPGHRRFAVVIERLGQKVRSGLAQPEDRAGSFFKVNHERLAGHAAAIEEAEMHWHDVRIYETPANTLDAGRAGADVAVSRQPSAVSFQPLAVSFRPLAVSFQPFTMFAPGCAGWRSLWPGSAAGVAHDDALHRSGSRPPGCQGGPLGAGERPGS